MRKGILGLVLIMMGVLNALTLTADGSSEPPSITLNGNSVIYLKKGTAYEEYGARAEDYEGNDISETIDITGSVNTNQVGSYTVVYSVTHSGHTVSTERKVRVVYDESFFYETGLSFSGGSSITGTAPVDGGFITVGWTRSTTSVTSLGLIRRVDYSGEQLWSTSVNKNLGNYVTSSVGTRFYSVTPTNDGNFVAVGERQNRNNLISDVLLFKFDSDGNEIWTRTYSPPGFVSWNWDFNRGLDITECSDGELLVVMYSSYSSAYRVARFSSQGSYQSMPYSSSSRIDAVAVNPLGGYLISVRSGNDTARVIISFDENDSVRWEHTITTQGRVIIRDIVVDDEGNVYLVGDTDGTGQSIESENFGDWSMLLYKIDNDGSKVFDRIYGGIALDEGHSVTLHDVTLIIGGRSLSPSFNAVHDGTPRQGLVVSVSKDTGDLLNFAKLGESGTSTTVRTVAYHNGAVIVGGTYGNNGTYGVIRTLIKAPDVELQYDDHSHNIFEGFKIETFVGDPVSHSPIIASRSLDPNAVGYQHIEYEFNVIEESGIRAIRYGRTYTVHPNLNNIEEDGVYAGSVELDIDGGEIYINDVLYQKGDTFNIPGVSNVEIRGINDYVKAFDITVEFIYSGVEKDGVYYDPIVPIFSGGTATLNGDPFESGTEIAHKGNHILVIEGANGFVETIEFVMHPTIEGVEDDTIYTVSLNPSINAEHMTLNGDPYDNEPITNAGVYTLVITGANDYEQVLNFEIHPTVTDLLDGGVYDGNVTPSINKGTLLLNGEPYTSGETITNPGINYLVIEGEGGYTKEITFTINLLVENVSQGLVVSGEVTPVFSGGQGQLNGVEFESGTTIDSPGNYSLVITGVNGFSRTISFIVTSEEINVSNNATYNNPVVPAISGGTLRVNGESYTSGDTLHMPGTYRLEVIGANGYYLRVDFTIASHTNVEDGEVYVGELNIEFTGEATLNGVPIDHNYHLTEVGNHTLVIDDGTTTTTYAFTLRPDLKGLYDSARFDDEVTIDIEHVDALVLNGEPISTPYLVDDVGTYELEITGVNGYQETLTFHVDFTTNLTVETTYIDAITPYISGGTVTLNGDPFVEGTSVTAIGKHEIVVQGINGYEKSIIFYVMPDISGVENQGVYFDEVTPVFDYAQVTLNGDALASNTTIDEPRRHTIVITGENFVSGGEHEFVIAFWILTELNVIEDAFYEEGFSVLVDDFDLLINGEPYVSGTPIDTLGEHALSIVDHHDNEYHIRFYIYPLLTDIEDGGEYNGNVTPIIDDATLYLNGDAYTSGTPIDEVGHHSLTMVMADDTEYTITFTVHPIIDDIEGEGVYVGAVTPNITGGDLFLNGQAYVSSTEIDVVGYHILSITGVNGYEKVISFTVTPYDFGIEDQSEHSDEILISVDSVQSLTLNGEAFDNHTTLSKAGNYVLRIYGLNGYVLEVEFVKHVSVENIEDDETYEGFAQPNIGHYDELLLNGEPYLNNTLITQVGHHTLTIKGVNGYELELAFTIAPDLQGLEDEGDYTGEITLDILEAILTLNGESYTSGTPIYEVGHYTLVITGINGYEDTMTFTLHPDIHGVLDGEQQSGSVTPIIEHAELTLNDKMFDSGTELFDVGHYTLVIEGVNGYEKIITFTLLPTIMGIEDGEEYTGSVMPTVDDALLYLNGDVFESGTTIAEVGHYTLLIEGINGFEKEVLFSILPEFEGFKDEGEYYSGITPIVHNATLILNGQPFDSGTPLVEVGIYTLIVQGINGFEKTVTFTIHPDITGVEDGGEYEAAVIPVIDNATLVLNGNPFTSGDEVTLVGNYTLEIEGLNDYLQTITFTIHPIITGVEDSLEYHTHVTPIIVHAVLELNGEAYVSGTRISAVGHYVLTVSGEGGYEMTIAFTIHYQATNVEDDETYSGFVQPIVLNAVLELNGVAFDSGDVIHEPGRHILDIFGEGDYHDTIEFILLPTVNAIDDQGEYIGNVTPDVPYGTLLLNGEPFTTDTKIDTVGHHVLTVVGANDEQFDYEFTIHPAISDLEEGAEYVGSVTPIVSDYVGLTLNGEGYSAGEAIQDVGYHTLTVIGINGYEKTVAFTIHSDFGGLEHQGKYDGEVLINIEHIDEVFINDSVFQNGLTLSTVGVHAVKITGLNGYEASITIDVYPNYEGVIDGGKYTDEVTITIENASQIEGIFLNDVPFVSGNTVSLLGHYTLRFEGVNGFVHEISFTRTPLILGVEDEGIYEETEVIPLIDNATLYLNGEPFESGTAIVDVGHYQLDIEGENNYSQTLTFTIRAVPSVYDGDSYVGSVSLIADNADIYLNGVKVPNVTLLKEVGNHTLEIIGVNGYHEVINFTLHPLVKGLEHSAEYYDEVFPSISATLMTLNGEAYDNEPISTIGHHAIIITGYGDYERVIEFTIHPSIEGIEDGEAYHGYVRLYSDYHWFYVNGEAYSPGGTISTVGHNKLRIEGVNNYVRILEFTIHPVYENISDGGRYLPGFAPRVNHAESLYLNDQPFSSGNEVNEIGKHTLYVFGLNGYRDQIEFFVDLDSDYLYDGAEFTGTFRYILTAGFTATINGNTYNNNSEFKVVGHHVFTLYGPNNYSREYHITIHPAHNAIPETTNQSVLILVEHVIQELRLDGEPILNGTRVRAIGYHTLEIVGVGNYTKTIDFTIIPDENLPEDNGTYTEPIVLTPTDYYELFLDGVLVEDELRLKRAGDYTLRIRGKNDYEETREFTLENVITGVEHGREYYGMVNITSTLDGVYINGDSIERSHVENRIGYHRLEVRSSNGLIEVIEFTIHPSSSAGPSNRNYPNGYTVNMMRAQSLQLNGETITNYTQVNEYGYHVLTVYGLNDYVIEYAFHVKPTSLINLHNRTSTSAVNIHQMDRAESIVLNGQTITSETTVDEAGNYTLIITGHGGYEETISFTIGIDYEHIHSHVNNQHRVELQSRNAIEIRLNGVKVDNGFVVNQVGHHTVEYRGHNNLNQIVDFTIHPVVPETLLDGVYESYARISIPNATLLLNGEPYTNNALITQVGNYTLTVQGVSGYEVEHHFIIVNEPVVGDFIVVNEPITIEINAVELRLNGEVIEPGHRITKTGSYQLIIIGENGYEDTINFDFVNENDFLSNLAYYIGVGVSALATGAIGFIAIKRFF